MRRPRRSLRTWLIAPTAAIVTILSATGALLQTDTLVRAWLGSTRQLSELAARQVTEFVLLRLEDVDASQRQAWLARIDNDAKLGGLLESSASGANSIRGDLGRRRNGSCAGVIEPIPSGQPRRASAAALIAVRMWRRSLAFGPCGRRVVNTNCVFRSG